MTELTFLSATKMAEQIRGKIISVVVGWLNFVKIDPVLDRLHSDRRFANVIRRMGFPN